MYRSISAYGPQGSEYFPTMISIKSDIPYRFNPNRPTTNSSLYKQSSLPQFNFNKVDCQLLSQLVDSAIHNLHNNATNNVEKYNQFTQVLLDLATKAIFLKRDKSNDFPPILLL